jgi:hypothetical protein
MARIQLEDLRDAFGSDLSALIEGHDVDANMRQRNREFVSSGYKPTRKEIWKHNLDHQPPIFSLVLP